MQVRKVHMGFPHGWVVKECSCQGRGCRRDQFHPQVGKVPWRRKWQPTPVFFPGEVHGQRSLAGYSLWGCRESEGLSTPECHSMTKLAVGWTVALEPLTQRATVQMCSYLGYFVLLWFAYIAFQNIVFCCCCCFTIWSFMATLYCQMRVSILSNKTF